jgi:acetylornithine deacetylase/succinyl-diaminopimelate desuccinylase-like protein
VMPTMGGSVPIWAFTDILKLPTILVPYANANNRQHSPNEHLRLDHLFQGVRTTAQLLRDLGGAGLSEAATSGGRRAE